MQIGISAAFGSVNHCNLLYKLRDVGVGGAVFDVIADFLSGRMQNVVVDGIRNGDVRVVFGVPHGSVLGPLLLLVYTCNLLIILENTLMGYVDDSSLLASFRVPAV